VKKEERGLWMLVEEEEEAVSHGEVMDRVRRKDRPRH
jgi:hypothetical protein